MSRNDKFGDEMEKLFNEETNNLVFTDEMMNKVLERTTRTRSNRVRAFLNYELQIPLLPAAVGIAALLAVSILPEGILEKQDKFTTIDIAGSQVMVQEDREVTRK